MKITRKGLAIGSFVVAYYGLIPIFNLMLVRSSDSTFGLLAPMYMLGILLVLLTVLLFNRNIKRISSSYIVVLLSIIVTFVLTQVNHSPTTVESSFFIMMTIIPFTIPQFISVDAKTVLKLLMILPSFGILFANSLFLSIEDSLGMDLSYALLLPVISSIVYGFTYLKNENKNQKVMLIIVLAINVFYFIYILLFGSRGPSLCVVLSFVFMWCWNRDKYSSGIKMHWKRLFTIAISIVVLVTYFEFFLYGFRDLLSSMGFEAYTLDTMIRYYEMGDLSDGREDINMLAWRGIMDSPFIGHGISSSERFTGHPYPHNFLLQLLLDGGAILFLLVMIPMLKAFLKGWKSYSYDEILMITVLFFASVPGALFSLDMWENARLWLFMGFLFSYRFKFDNQIKI